MSACQIVVIEDNPADVLLIKMALEESGVICQVTRFRNGKEAVETLCAPDGAETNGFVPDAILLDLNTPKSDGFDVLIRLKNTPRLAHVPVAILTSSQAAIDKNRAGNLGANRYIQKPSQLDEFLTKVGQGVKEMLGAEQTVHENAPDDPGTH